MRPGRFLGRLGATAVILVAGAALAAEAGLPATSTQPTRAEIRQAIDGVVLPYMEANPGDLIGICVGAIDGKLGATKCYGKIAANQSAVPDRDTLFGIGSVTKTFAATLLALRVQQGSVHLTDRVRKYIPPADGAAHVPKAMTLLDLADHYSGLPRNPAPQPSPATAHQVFSDLADCEQAPGCPNDVPAASFFYSNFAYATLGELLAVHDGIGAPAAYSEWDVDNEKNVTGPLGMQRTKSWYHWKAVDPVYFNHHRAIGQVGNPPHEPVPPQLTATAAIGAAGGLMSSSVDMLKWLAYSMGFGPPSALAHARHLLYHDTAHIRLRGANANKKIGLAWNLDVNADGTTCIQKGGSVPGFRAYIIFVDKKQRGAFVLLNNSPQHTNAGALGTQILNALPAVTSAVPACGVSKAEE